EQLKVADCVECRAVMRDDGNAARSRPANDQHVEASRPAKQLMSLEIPNGQVRQPALFRRVDGCSRSFKLIASGRAHLDKDDAVALQGHQVDLTEGAPHISVQDSKSTASQETRRSSLRAGAEPAAPPG